MWSQCNSHRPNVHLSHHILHFPFHRVFDYLGFLRWVIDLRQVLSRPCELFIFQFFACNTISQSQTWWSLFRLPLFLTMFLGEFSVISAGKISRKFVCFHFSSRMFGNKRNKANLSVIFGRTVDKLLQQILENALNDFINSWLRWVYVGEV